MAKFRDPCFTPQEGEEGRKGKTRPSHSPTGPIRGILFLVVMLRVSFAYNFGIALEAKGDKLLEGGGETPLFMLSESSS